MGESPEERAPNVKIMSRSNEKGGSKCFQGDMLHSLTDVDAREINRQAHMDIAKLRGRIMTQLSLHAVTVRSHVGRPV